VLATAAVDLLLVRPNATVMQQHVSLFSAIAVSFVVFSTPDAADDLTTLKGFERAFRRAHDRHDVRRMESLVCWDATTPQMRQHMHFVLIEGLRRPIGRIEITTFTKRTAPEWERDPNIKPAYVFTVWYSGETTIVPYTARFIGRKRGRFYFVVWRESVPLPVYASWITRSNQSLQPTAGRSDD
jgi:hypothetical protein